MAAVLLKAVIVAEALLLTGLGKQMATYPSVAMSAVLWFQLITKSMPS